MLAGEWSDPSKIGSPPNFSGCAPYFSRIRGLL